MPRKSSQQERVLDLVRESERPLSADEIRAQIGIDAIGQATVYRALQRGVREGFLRAVEVPGTTPRYERSDLEHHHHFSCRDCGQVFDLPGCAGEMDQLLPDGFRLESHEILLFGQCATCTA